MTFTPEHDKVEALRSSNPVAANLAYLLLDSEGWTLSNRAGSRDIDIPVQNVVADLLGVNFTAYQEERREELGLSRADASIAGTIRSWTTDTPEVLLEETDDSAKSALGYDFSKVRDQIVEASGFKSAPELSGAAEVLKQVSDSTAAKIFDGLKGALPDLSIKAEPFVTAEPEFIERTRSFLVPEVVPLPQDLAPLRVETQSGAFEVETRPETDGINVFAVEAEPSPAEEAIIEAIAEDTAEPELPALVNAEPIIFPFAEVDGADADELPSLELPDFGATVAVPDAAEEEKEEFVETGSYSLLDAKPSDTPQL